MTPLDLWDAGYQDLVCVIPPDGELLPTSRIRPKDRGKAPGKRVEGGWHGYGFTKAPAPSRENVEKWLRWEANVGLRGDYYPALDIDSNDPELTPILLAEAERYFGPSNWGRRDSRVPRAMLIARTEEPFRRMGLVITRHQQTNLVEWLGKGHQYVVHGTHPSGCEYSLRMPPRDALRVVTREQALGFLHHVADLCQQAGLEVELVGTGEDVAALSPPQENLKAPGPMDLARVVAEIPNPATWGWSEMVTMGYACKAAGQDFVAEARSVWLEWCDRWEGAATYTPEEYGHEWSKFSPPFRVGWTYLQNLAEDKGEYCVAEDLFAPTLPARVDAPYSHNGVSDHNADRYSGVWIAEQLAPVLRPLIRYGVRGASNTQWWRWMGSHWMPAAEAEVKVLVVEASVQLAARLHQEAEAAGVEAGKKARVTALYLQEKRGVYDALFFLEGVLLLHEEDLDADRMVLNTPAGEVDLKTGLLHDPDPEHLHHRQTAYRPASGPHPMWDSTLEILTGRDEEFSRYLQKLLGYCLTGLNTIKAVHFAIGTTNTCKSTFWDTCQRVLGDYVTTTNPSIFLTTGRSDNSREDALARFQGARLVLAGEPSQTAEWDEYTIKTISGGDRIEARQLHRSTFAYDPTYKVVIHGNHEPTLDTADDAMRDRLRVLPFIHQVPKGLKDPTFKERLPDAEGPQILRWMIEGCLLFQEEGLTPPPAIAGRTAAYVDEPTPLADWIEERCELDPAAWTHGAEVWESWKNWCYVNGYRPRNKRTLYRMLRDHASPVIHKEQEVRPNGSRGRQGIRGIRLRTLEATFTTGES